MAEAFVRLADDSAVTGKRMATEQVLSSIGDLQHIQKATLVDNSGEALAQLVALNFAQLRVLRAILAITQANSSSRITEDDFNNALEI
jgi:hypothetical protein